MTLNFVSKLWQFFTSVRLTVVVLLALAMASIIGTVIPQNQNQAAYIEHFGKPVFTFLNLFQIFDMYHSWWFQLLLVLLLTNIVICSINRLSSTWKIIFDRTPKLTIAKFRRQTHRQTFTNDRSTKHLAEVYRAFIAKKFGYTHMEEISRGVAIFAEKQRWTRLGVYVVHLSVVLLAVGGLMGSLLGYEGYINIAEGESEKSIWLKNAQQKKPLDFEIRCDDFSVTFYQSGAPKEYRSKLTILEAGKPVLTQDIIVNHPLHYKGVNIFQASYGKLGPKANGRANETGRQDTIRLILRSKATGMEYEREATMGKPFDLPEDKGTFVINDYQASFQFGDMALGETYLGLLEKKGEKPVEITLPVNFSRFDMMRKGDLFIAVSRAKKPMPPTEQRYYTGLQITRDPGVPMVYAGFIAMIVGCFLTFFMFHQQLCIEIIKSGSQSRVIVSGFAVKNKMGMQRRVEAIAQRLSRL
jgi:cytochrome c biogenesis protein